MTDNVSRAAEAAPKILGVEMRRSAVNGWQVCFGGLSISIAGAAYSDRYSVTCGAQLVSMSMALPEAIAAIELELLAIRDAIPAREQSAAKPADSGEVAELRDDGEPEPPGMTVGQLLDALANAPRHLSVTVRTEEFTGGVVSASSEDSCSGYHFAIDCSDDAEDFE